MQNLKSILYKKKEMFYVIILFLFSVSINQYYGNLGICPIDSFFSFNSGYDILNGYFPFKDYWTIAGPFIALSQALFFKLFGVSWFSYVMHASFFNFILAISTFYTLHKFKLSIHYCFLYSLLVSILTYPSAGTPYVDHHSSILSIISIYIFVLALKTNSKIYWYILPIVLVVSFLTKQTPTGYIFLIIAGLSTFYFVFNFNIKKILLGLFGSITIISIFLMLLSLGEISILSFFQQYILFPISFGKVRYEYFLFPLEFSRIFLRYKLIHLSSLLLVLVALINIKNNFRYLKNNELLIILSLLGSSYALIAHQLMTINGIFIYFIIPILTGFSHIYYLKYFKDKKNILYLLLFLSISSTLYYGYEYVHKRDFMDLRKVNMEGAIDAEILDSKLKGLKWKSCLFYADDTKKEIDQLSEVIALIKNDDRNKSIITDYQFISVILSLYDFAPSQVWFDYHVNPSKESIYYDIYRSFFIGKFKENNVQVVYLIKPLWGGNDIFEKVFDTRCYKKNKISEMLDIYTLLPCEDLKI
jgi:hypothetical protein